jgi:hypothetical protein
MNAKNLLSISFSTLVLSFGTATIASTGTVPAPGTGHSDGKQAQPAGGSSGDLGGAVPPSIGSRDGKFVAKDEKSAERASAPIGHEDAPSLDDQAPKSDPKVNASDDKTPGIGIRAGEAILCEGDVDDNGRVGFEDVLEVFAAWGMCDGREFGSQPCRADLDRSGYVDWRDLLFVLNHYGTICFEAGK